LGTGLFFVHDFLKFPSREVAQSPHAAVSS
jgi:hypothetical protein